VSLHWSWGLSTALILALVIHLNGRGVRAGWLLGASVQVINLVFGYFVYGQWTFLFLAIPAAMFAINWVKHPARTRRGAVRVPDPRRPCASTLNQFECDREREHDGPHVGFDRDEHGLTVLKVWEDEEADPPPRRVALPLL
jgi:hypothetical protein